MKRLLLFILLTLPFCSSAQTPALDSAWLVTHYTKREVSIAMRDGIKLFTAIYEQKLAASTR
jgi:predicted acyl esterase